MSNMNIYKVMKIGILVLLISTIVSMISSVVFMTSPSAQIVFSTIVSIVVLGWTVFQAYKIWSVKGVNSGFRKFAVAGIIVYIFSILSSIFTVISGIRSIGKPVPTAADFSSGNFQLTGVAAIDNIITNPTSAESISALKTMAVGAIIVSIVGGAIFIYLMYRYYTGFYSGTAQLLEDNSDTVDQAKKMQILEKISGLTTLTKVMYIYIPIVFIALMCIAMLLLLAGSGASAVMVGLLFLLLLPATVVGIIFYVKIYQLSSIADETFREQRYWL